MWRVKICGNRTPAEIVDAIAAGADAVGVIVGVRHRSEDALSPDVAAGLLTAAAGFPAVRTVLVTHAVSVREVVGLHCRVPADVIQLHDDIAPDDLRQLRAALPGARLLKAVHVEGAVVDVVRAARAHARTVDALLLDSRTADRIGGTGRVHDWRISAEVVRALAPLPVILAGGLTPGNVARAIAVASPHGVDVNSGVDGPDGAKDPGEVARFVDAARAALERADDRARTGRSAREESGA